MKNLKILFCFMLAFLLGQTTSAQNSDPLSLPCIQRPTHREIPWHDDSRWCLEVVYIHNDPQLNATSELMFTALATGANGQLYAASPYAGAIYTFDDTDNDLLPDTPRVLIDGLTLPNGMDFHDGALYVSGGANVYRIVTDGVDAQIETLVGDLPAGGGFWTGGIAVDDEGSFYVATGAPCDYCEFDDEGRGAIWHFSADGSERTLMATGFRQPADLAFHLGELWTVDTTRDNLDVYFNDELIRVEQSGFYGFPYCLAAHNVPDTLQTDFDCSLALPPAMHLPTYSNPLGIASYVGDAFPDLQGKMLLVWHGPYNDYELEDIGLVAVSFNAEGLPEVGFEVLIPQQDPDIRVFGAAFPLPPQPVAFVNMRGYGFWPQRPFDVTVNDGGWIYISAGGGRVYALRPTA